MRFTKITYRRKTHQTHNGEICENYHMHVHRVEPIDGESPTNAGLSFTLMMMMTTRRDWGENWVTLLTSPIHASPYGIDTLGQNLC